MPELPEVETTRRTLTPLIVGRRVQRVVIRERRLRWPISPQLSRLLPGQEVRALDRRAKYLLLGTEVGTAILHLGMSGSLSQVDPATPPAPHEHYDLVFEGPVTIRYRDPRRFGAFLWTADPPERHRLLCALGPEPLPGPSAAGIDGAHLYRLARGRRVTVRNFLLDGRIVVGVGNIYASEACFHAGIRPDRAAGRVSRARYDRLADAVRTTLEAAIAAGGTTLRDFHDASGRAGAYGGRLDVYGREAAPCRRCRGLIRRGVVSARSYYYCPKCQR